MVREYELMYIVRPEVDDDGLREATDSIENLITGLGGEIEKTALWGKRRLAYEVKHLRDGHYVITHLTLEGDKVKEVERALRIHDTVFRHLLVLREGVGPLDGEDQRAVARAEAASAAAAAAEAGETTTEEAAAAPVATTEAADDDVVSDDSDSADDDADEEE